MRALGVRRRRASRAASGVIAQKRSAWRLTQLRLKPKPPSTSVQQITQRTGWPNRRSTRRANAKWPRLVCG